MQVRAGPRPPLREASIRTYWLFPAGLAAGVAVAWAALTWLSSGRPDDAVGGAHEAGSPAGAMSEARGPAPGPTAAGPGVLAMGGGPRDAAETEEQGPAVPLSSEALDRLREFERSGAGDAASSEYWLALGRLYALAGCPGDVARVAERAVDAGADADEVVALVNALPVPSRIEAIEAVRTRRPEAGWSAIAVARVHAGAGDVGGAVAILTKDLESSSEPLRVAEVLIQIDADRAGPLLDAFAVRLSWEGDLLARIAGHFVQADRRDLALQFVRRAMALGAGGRAVMDVLAKVDPPAALAAAEKAVAENEADVATWGRLGQMRLAAGDAKGAFEAYRRAALLQPDEDEWLEGLLKTDPVAALPVLAEATRSSRDDEAVGLLARAYVATGRVAEALEAYSRALELDPTDFSWLRGLVRLAPEQAIDRIQGLLAQPRLRQHDEVIGAYANALLAAGDPAGAFDRYAEAHRQDPTDLEWLRGMAEADAARALPLVEAHRRSRPDDEDVDGILGDVYAGMGKREDAISAYERAIERDETNLYWMAALAQVAPERGLSLLRGAIDRKPTDDDAWGMLGRAYRKLGRAEEARAAYDKAVSLDPTDSDWLLERAMLP